MQVLDRNACAADAYVAQRHWERTVLCGCPFHPEGGCGLERLASYSRVRPAEVRVARFWCPRERASVSVLPAFLAARFVGTLDDVESVVDAVSAAGSVTRAADLVHPPDAPKPLGYDAAIASVRRRVRAVHPEHTRGLYLRLAEKAAQEYTIPGTLRRRVAVETLRGWLRAYRRGGFDALVPRQRADLGSARAIPPAETGTTPFRTTRSARAGT